MLRLAYEGASTTANKNDEAREVRSVIRERVASIVGDSSVVAGNENGQGTIDGQWERVEVGDRVVLNAVDGGILQVDDGVVKTGHRNRVDSVAGARCVPGTLVSVVTWEDPLS